MLTSSDSAISFIALTICFTENANAISPKAPLVIRGAILDIIPAAAPRPIAIIPIAAALAIIPSVLIPSSIFNAPTSTSNDAPIAIIVNASSINCFSILAFAMAFDRTNNIAVIPTKVAAMIPNLIIASSTLGVDAMITRAAVIANIAYANSCNTLENL